MAGNEQAWPLAELPANWKADAARYKVLPGHVWNTEGKFDLVATGLQLGLAGWIGIRWPGGGGHSVLCTSLRKVGSVWYLRGPNSWGRTWNTDGFFELSEAQCASMPGHGSFAVQQVVWSGPASAD